MFLKRLFARKNDTARDLYEAIVAAARRVVFYERLGVPDTVDGRFDMISLHLFLVLDRLKGQGPEVEDLRQRLTDGFFLDMDRSLREMGVGDLSVGKKVRKMAEAFYGRVKAYDAALARGQGLDDALRRNIFPDCPRQDVEALASWTVEARASLLDQRLEDLLKGKVTFP